VKPSVNRFARLSLTALGLLALAVPASVVTTIALFPLWSWFERYTGIESMGHSGPADWCYLAVFLTMALAIAFFTWIRHRGKERAPNDN
jgi:membrane protease YdiL (CAAX protease family)